MNLAPAIGPLSVFGPHLSQLKKGSDYPRPDNAISPRLIELANKPNEQSFPEEMLKNKLADIDKIRDLGLINPGVYDKARSNVARETAERLEIDTQPHLTDAVLAGSQEDARIRSNFFAGSKRQTTEDWLRRIYESLEATRRAGIGENGIRAISVAATGGG